MAHAGQGLQRPSQEPLDLFVAVYGHADRASRPQAAKQAVSAPYWVGWEQVLD
jgi:hypothetical protein